MNAHAAIFAPEFGWALFHRSVTRPGRVALPLRHRIFAGPMTDAPPKLNDHVSLIIAIAQHRDRNAFALLFRYYAPRVKAWMMQWGVGAAAAEELAQDTMLVVWRKAQLFNPDRAAPSTWIFTIARNQRIDAMRRERHPSTLMPDQENDLEPPSQPDHLVTLAEQEARIREALQHLPPEQADVIRKAFFEDKPHIEIEKELGIPLGTVKSRLRLATNRLRLILKDLL